jgi:hypothetical protein
MNFADNNDEIIHDINFHSWEKDLEFPEENTTIYRCELCNAILHIPKCHEK